MLKIFLNSLNFFILENSLKLPDSFKVRELISPQL